jgi:glycosyltransferase involved in cell wall biosynthesis
MRIAYVTETYPPELNGVALTVERTVCWLRERGHRVSLIRPRQAHERRAEDQTILAPGVPIPMYPALRIGLPIRSRLLRCWRRERPDLVHAATEGPLGSAAISAARELGIPVTSDFRTNFHQYGSHYALGWAEPLIRAYLRRFHNRTDLTFAPTREVVRQLLRDGVARVAEVGRGVDPHRFSPARRSAGLRASWNAAADAPVILCVGRLAAEKNVPLVLRAFAAIRGQCPAARLVLVGDGPLRRQLQREHRDVVFSGALSGDALAAAYASADIFLFPSLTETFGNVTLEALASGLVVVAYDTGAAAQHIEHEVSGFLVSPESDSQFVVAAAVAAMRLGELRTMRRSARVAAIRAAWPKVLALFEAHLLGLIRDDESRGGGQTRSRSPETPSRSAQ